MSSAPRPYLMVVEDDPRLCGELALLLREEGWQVRTATSAEEAHDALLAAPRPPSLLLSDVRLPGASGVDLVRRLAEAAQLPPTVVLSGAATISETVEALRLGVHDFLEKPFSRERLMRSIHNALELASLRRQVASLETRVEKGSRLIGQSAGMARVRELVARTGPTDARILILGESGTGKELVAEALHEASSRRQRPFVRVNCAAIPDTLIEAELFGHVRGAFTDARADRAGLFEEADGGTLLLDEIGDMPLGLQGRLLRVLEDGLVRRVGETRSRQVDVRVLAATHHDLEREVAEEGFRQDLYFRLSSIAIPIPPLRERREDIPLLTAHFLEQLQHQHERPQQELDPAVLPLLERHSWPGNVRELRATCERMVVLGGSQLGPDLLPPSITAPTPCGTPSCSEGSLDLAAIAPGTPLREMRQVVDRAFIALVLARTGWNVSAAARELGLHRTFLHRRMEELELARPNKAQPEPAPGAQRPQTNPLPVQRPGGDP
jgi:two-component system, NtrC family, nitrogen regulation response regulator NtrX